MGSAVARGPTGCISTIRAQLPVIIADHAEHNVEGLVNLEPRVHDDHRTGLAQTHFWVTNIRPYQNATKYTIELHCDRALTSWCERPPT